MGEDSTGTIIPSLDLVAKFCSPMTITSEQLSNLAPVCIVSEDSSIALELLGVLEEPERDVASVLIAVKANRAMKEFRTDCNFLMTILVSSCLQSGVVCLPGFFWRIGGCDYVLRVCLLTTCAGYLIVF